MEAKVNNFSLENLGSITPLHEGWVFYSNDGGEHYDLGYLTGGTSSAYDIEHNHCVEVMTFTRGDQGSSEDISQNDILEIPSVLATIAARQDAPEFISDDSKAQILDMLYFICNRFSRAILEELRSGNNNPYYERNTRANVEALIAVVVEYHPRDEMPF